MSCLDNLQADVEEWLPAISLHLPGSGITPFNVWDLELRWWLVYRATAKAVIDAHKKIAKK